ncbi:MAG: peroxidase-related enzyme [Gemmatimonadetes bacterium]|nr:peroxidase-related enzyme [Gemmatimonadota bacterium]
MPFLPSVGPEDKVPHVLGKFNTGTGKPLIEYHEALLRGESPFTVAEREMMAAYVSGINACQYCQGAHTAAAAQFGVPEPLIADLLRDASQASVSPKMRPVLSYLRKLTQSPTKMTQADADAVYAAGWTERALYDAVQICCLYNFMNRFVEGIGLTAVPGQFAMEGRMIKDGGYKGMIDAFGIK